MLALFFVSTLNYADRTAITALYTLLKTDLGFTDVGLGALGSMFLWSYAFSSPFSGFLGDRVRRGRLVLWSLAGWSLVTLLTGLAATQWQLLGMRGALGLVEAMYLPAAMALVAEYHGTETRGTALALMALGNYVGMAGGGAVAGYFGEHYGWRVPLVALGAAGLVLAAICRFILPAGRTEPSEKSKAAPLSFPAAAAALLRIPSFLVLAGAGVLTAIGTWIFINWLPLYFRENMGMTLASAGFFGSSLVSLSGAAGQVVGGVVSDRVARGGPHRRMLLQAVLILCAAPMLLAFVLTRSLTLIMAALVVYSAATHQRRPQHAPAAMRSCRCGQALDCLRHHEYGEHAGGRAGRVCGRVSEIGLRLGWRVRRGRGNPRAGCRAAVHRLLFSAAQGPALERRNP